MKRSSEVAPGLVPGGNAASLTCAMLALALASSCARASAEESAKPVASLGELSALVALPSGRFLMIDDERGVLLLESATATSGRLVLAMNDLEGLCAAPDGRFLAIAEGSGVVTAFTLEGKAETLGTLAHPPRSDGKKTKANKGWEGIVFLPADRSYDKKAHLVAVHEGGPKALAIFAWPSLAHEHTSVLSGYLDDQLVDLSDVGFDAKTGALMLVSDESARIVHGSLIADSVGAPIFDVSGLIELPMAKGEKAEGVAVDDNGALWIVTDATGKLVRVASTITTQK